jgi:hypothetical protein
VFPVYHVLADIGEFAGGDVSDLRSSDPLRVNGLMLRNGSRMRLLLANFTPSAQHITLHHHARPVGMRTLDETNALDATQRPEAYRARPREPVASAGDMVETNLLPFAVMTLDLIVEQQWNLC